MKSFKEFKEGFGINKIILPLMLMIFLMTGCGNSDDINKLVIGIDEGFAPMSFHDEKNILVGFDIDLARETARRMGVAVEFKPIDWDKKEEAITSGSVDLIWNGLDITDERKEYMIFSKPYMDDRQIPLVKKDSDWDISSEYDLAGKIIGTQAGSTSDDYINKNLKLKNNLKGYKTYGKFNDLVVALKNNEIEVIICDELVARYEMTIHPDEFKIINAKIGVITQTGIGFAKNNPKLRDKVQKAFDEMISDGTAQKISQKWFHGDLIKVYR